MVVLADLHFAAYNQFGRPWKHGCSTQLEAMLNALEDAFHLAVGLSEETIVILGDIFHAWKAVDTPVLFLVAQRLYDLLAFYRHINIIVLPGNHDLVDKSNPILNTIKGLAGHPQITLVDGPTLMEIDDKPFVLIPYHSDADYILQQARDMAKDVTDPWLLSHLDIIGAKAGIDGYKSKKGINLHDLDCFAGGIWGHYHTPQEFNLEGRLFYYVGSMVQLGIVNSGEDHGCLVWPQNKSASDIYRAVLEAPHFVRLNQGDEPCDLREKDYHYAFCDNPEDYELIRGYYKEFRPKIFLRKNNEGSYERPKALASADIENSEVLLEEFVESLGVCEMEREALVNWGRHYLGWAQ